MSEARSEEVLQNRPGNVLDAGNISSKSGRVPLDGHSAVPQFWSCPYRRKAASLCIMYGGSNNELYNINNDSTSSG
ncbi:unnamed protein product [Enterobius vermicularis]|uniref:Uncharacterized protein n=1 Tax=Enterobius vermicularis TaxID=51028 RepID=A0A0N4V1P9_ENTVE|nr:unnamed protein product [Enterobius vermicularis]